MEQQPALEAAAGAAREFLDSLGERPVWARASYPEMLATLGGALPEDSTPAELVVRELARLADPGLVAIPSGRFFGFVIGGSLPAALAADWLTSVWDQNAGLATVTPAAASCSACRRRRRWGSSPVA
jgi:glutamate/tyrosine decarboxylase-like PLP-dependent enzyme